MGITRPHPDGGVIKSENEDKVGGYLCSDRVQIDTCISLVGGDAVV